jgi:hypothetical protein
MYQRQYGLDRNLLLAPGESPEEAKALALDSHDRLEVSQDWTRSVPGSVIQGVWGGIAIDRAE